MEIYDDIAENYKKQTLSSFERKATVEYSLFKYLGDLRGKSVLDFGCGEGHYTRLIKQHGAASVVGVDISGRMIALAKSEEERSPLGIRYDRYDAVNFPVIGEFDIIAAVFLLHYSRTADELFRMCKNIYANLKDGGRFVCLNNNPVSPLQPDGKHDFTITCGGPLTEGCAVKVTLYIGDKPACCFDNYYWKKETYEEALKAAGFDTVKWRGIAVSEEGIGKFGPGFWEDYLKRPGITVLECSKPRERSGHP